MSHITTCEIEVRNLEALKLAAADCGLTFKEGQRTYRWYGHWVGDSPLPKGMTKEDCGKCSHALSVNNNPRAYEIGLASIKNDEGEDVWQLRYDFWNGGYGLEAVAGKNCGKLLQRYGYHQARMQAEQLGWEVSEETLPDGSIKLTCTEQAQQFATCGSW